MTANYTTAAEPLQGERLDGGFGATEASTSRRLRDDRPPSQGWRLRDILLTIVVGLSLAAAILIASLFAAAAFWPEPQPTAPGQGVEAIRMHGRPYCATGPGGMYEPCS